MKIVCVGDCGIDHYRPSEEMRVGGITANVARHARAEFSADDKVYIVSCVGDDDAAQLVLDELLNSGIDCLISTLPGKTPVQSIEIEPNGEKSFVHYDAGVLADLRFTNEQTELIATADLVVAPVYLQIVGLFDTLMSIQPGGLVAIDFADFLEHPDFGLLERHIDSIDIGFFGLTPDDTSTIGEIARLANAHGKLFVVTLGASGSRAFSGSKRFECEALPVTEVIDTTGAGDAYAAAFLAEFCRSGDIDAAMRRGAERAAKIIGYIGYYELG